ncbi:MAG: hypothetical protein J07HB67_01856 [halophilic archaeon J07HB67]|jgi:hypothetical protein|nr:MAG: hypothetical protein J07HB67_01856 [halophilic archaeon J07HB67]
MLDEMSKRELDDDAVGRTARPRTNEHAEIDGVRFDQLETLLDKKRLRFVQQILAHDSGVLSVEELSYRNPDIELATVDYHLRKLESVGLTERLSADDPANHLPNTYWAVTDRGVARLDKLGFYDEVEALTVADEMLERTERIERIETFDGRPQVDVSQ